MRPINITHLKMNFLTKEQVYQSEYSYFVSIEEHQKVITLAKEAKAEEISVKESMAIITEVWKKYKDYPPKWKAQRIIYICNKKYNKAITLAKEAKAEEIKGDIQKLENSRITDNNNYISIPIDKWFEFKKKYTI